MSNLKIVFEEEVKFIASDKSPKCFDVTVTKDSDDYELCISREDDVVFISDDTHTCYVESLDTMSYLERLRYMPKIRTILEKYAVAEDRYELFIETDLKNYRERLLDMAKAIEEITEALSQKN
jgi:hypothetical protein